jgi:hypothetical protein
VMSAKAWVGMRKAITSTVEIGRIRFMDRV